MADWRVRIGKTAEEIERGLDRPLDLQVLAASIACSRFHFQRLFSAFTGSGVVEFRRLHLLKRAGQQLAFRAELSITEIGFETGYENLESFSRAFKRTFGQSPSRFRAAPDWTVWHQTYDPLLELKGTLMPDTELDFETVRIVDFPETPVALLEHRGSPVALPSSLRAFIAWRKQHGTPPSRSATYNILYEDPKSSPPEDYRFGICCQVFGAVAENDQGVRAHKLPAGRCAVIRHKGPLDLADGKIRALYRDWLPHSGEDLRDAPLFVQRLSFFPDVTEYEAETDIFLPLK